MSAPVARADPPLGTPLVVCGPSGAGKTTLVRRLVESDPAVELSVSHTTRARREAERDGVHYHFVDDPQFDAMIEAGEFLEHARVFEHRSGTARAPIEQRLHAGRDVILEIDWQGARQVRELLPDAVSVFILPPSRAALEERLATRGQDSPRTIEGRMAKAVAEMAHWEEFDYVIVNERFADALGDLQAVLRALRLVRERQCRRHADLFAALLA